MFCRYCGKELTEESAFCSHCGKSTSEQTSSGEYNTYTPSTTHPLISGQELVKKFSERLQINSIIWIVVGGIQILLGIYFQWVFFMVGVLNLIIGILDLQYAKKVLQNPKGIVDRVRPLVGPIIVLIYNLLLGALLGIVGSVYYLVAIRGFVMENESQFLAIDNALNHQHQA